MDHDTMIESADRAACSGRSIRSSRLVTLAARRARKINSYFNQLGDGLGHMVPPQVSSVARKPLSIGFEEIAQHKIVWTEAPVEAEVDPEAEARRWPTPPARASSPPIPTTPDRRRPPSRRMSSALAGKRIVLGVTGGIAAYKAIEVCRRLVDAGAHVVPVMTTGAERFIGRTTLSALASEPVQTASGTTDHADPAHQDRPGRRPRPRGARDGAARSPPTGSGLSTDLLTNTLSPPVPRS